MPRANLADIGNSVGEIQLLERVTARDERPRAYGRVRRDE